MSGLLMAPVAPRASLTVTTKPNRGTDTPRQERNRARIHVNRPKPLAFILGAVGVIDTGPDTDDREDSRVKMASEGHLDPRCAIHGPRTDASKLPMTMVVKSIVNAPKRIVINLGERSYVDDNGDIVTWRIFNSVGEMRRAGFPRSTPRLEMGGIKPGILGPHVK